MRPATGFSTLDSAPFVPKGHGLTKTPPLPAVRPHRSTVATRPTDAAGPDTVIYEAHLKGFSTRASDRCPQARQRHLSRPTSTWTKEPAGRLSGPAWGHHGGGVFAARRVLRRAPPCRRLGLTNYWGYNPLHFFVPTDRYYAVPGADPVAGGAGAGRRAFIRAGLEVLLDVVFNHTAESDHLGPTLSFRGHRQCFSYYHSRPRQPGPLLSTPPAPETPSTAVIRRSSGWCWTRWPTGIKTLGFDGFRFDLASTHGARTRKGRMQRPPGQL